MAHIYFDIIRRANSTAYAYGDLVAPATLNDHVYMCTTPGTSGSSPPTWNTGAGSTTTDGTVTWTEYNPSGIIYSAILQFERNPSYGDYERQDKIVQPKDYSEGGDLYSYTKGIQQKMRTLTWKNISATTLQKFIEFISIIRGVSFSFNFADSDGTVYRAWILNGDDIKSRPVAYSRESFSVELLIKV